MEKWDCETYRTLEDLCTLYIMCVGEGETTYMGRYVPPLVSFSLSSPSLSQWFSAISSCCNGTLRTEIFSFKQKINLTARFIIPNKVNTTSWIRIRCKRVEMCDSKRTDFYKEMCARGKVVCLLLSIYCWECATVANSFSPPTVIPRGLIA